MAIAADGPGFPWKLQWFDVREISVAFAVEFGGNYRVLEDCRGNCRGWPWNAVVFRGNCSGLTSVKLPWQLPPWQLPWSSVAIATYWRIAVAVAADGRGMPWFTVEIAVD